MTTPATLALIRALIPLGLQAVEDALVAEVTALAGPRYTRDAEHPAVVRWGAQPGSIFLADQKLPITVPRVRDREAQVRSATHDVCGIADTARAGRGPVPEGVGRHLLSRDRNSR